MTSNEDLYFSPSLDPSQSVGPLTTAWKKLVEDHYGAYSFWTKYWGQKDQPSLQLTDDHTNLFPEHLRASLPPQIPVFPVWRAKENPSHALVRDEYGKIYQWLHNNCEHRSNRREAMMITGHPGIGKTIFQAFVLYRRCTEQKPTLYHDPNDTKLFLFYAGGVASLSLSLAILQDPDSFDSHFRIFTPKTWLLVDGSRDPAADIPPRLRSPLIAHKSPRIIFTASPAHIKKFKVWADHHREFLSRRTIYMQGWKDPEIILGAVLHNTDWTTVEKRLSVAGRVPRHIFNTCSSVDFHEVEQNITAAVRELSAMTSNFLRPEDLEYLVYEVRTDEGDICARPTRVFLSEFVIDKVLRLLSAPTQEKRKDLVDMLEPRSGQATQLVGDFHEVPTL